MNKPNWKEHIRWPSLIGEPEEECPIFIGPEPSMEARREYMGAYLPWATGFGTKEWFDVNRPGAERITAEVHADRGRESFGQDRWEFAVDITLWNMAFRAADSKERPAFSWQPPSNTAGGESETYNRLKIYRRAEVEADEFLDRLAQRLAQADSEAQAGQGPEAQG